MPSIQLFMSVLQLIFAVSRICKLLLVVLQIDLSLYWSNIGHSDIGIIFIIDILLLWF